MGRRLKNGNIGGSAFWCMLFGSVSNRPTASLKPGATPCNSCVLFASFDILALFLLYYVEHQNIQNKRGESTSERGREKERERERDKEQKKRTRKSGNLIFNVCHVASHRTRLQGSFSFGIKLPNQLPQVAPHRHVLRNQRTHAVRAQASDVLYSKDLSTQEASGQRWPCGQSAAFAPHVHQPQVVERQRPGPSNRVSCLEVPLVVGWGFHWAPLWKVLVVNSKQDLHPSIASQTSLSLGSCREFSVCPAHRELSVSARVLRARRGLLGRQLVETRQLADHLLTMSRGDGDGDPATRQRRTSAKGKKQLITPPHVNNFTKYRSGQLVVGNWLVTKVNSEL